MGRPRLICKPTPTATRLILLYRGEELLRASLPPPSLGPSQYMRAAPMLCETLSRWLDKPLSVVLCADEPDGTSGLGLCDELGFGVKTLNYEVEVMEARRPRSLGSFADLRRLQLHLRGLR